MPSPREKPVPIEVRSSTIHGSGAFASRALKPGTFVGRYTGRRYSAEEVAAREWDHALTFVFGLADGSVIDGAEGGNATRHINHSCTPNCVAFEIEPEEGPSWIEVEALLPIAKGAEMFLDYGLEASGASPEDFACHCGTANCRGSMISAAAMP